uniref:E3 ubiquitin-protein ligase n=1 Tax=Labrus bergylta TaxID=56723 RepID=A0A3Q3LEA1_9LABR
MIALTSLLTSHPDIQINYRATEELCTLQGAYSKIQAALAQLLSYPGGPQSAGAKDPSQLIHDTPQESRSAVGGLCICVCGERDKLMKRTKCGATFCSKCLDIEHAQCSVCDEAEQTPQGIQGKMKYSKIYIRVPGHHKDSAIKVTYKIPDGVQGEGHPSPGKPFKGGLFEAFFPDCEETRRQLPRLDKAFKKGLTFTVIDRETGAKVEWDCIPHKTSLQGGKAGSGYPDSFYLTRLSKVLTSHGIEEPTTRYLE